MNVYDAVHLINLKVVMKCGWLKCLLYVQHSCMNRASITRKNVKCTLGDGTHELITSSQSKLWVWQLSDFGSKGNIFVMEFHQIYKIYKVRSVNCFVSTLLINGYLINVSILAVIGLKHVTKLWVEQLIVPSLNRWLFLATTKNLGTMPSHASLFSKLCTQW